MICEEKIQPQLPLEGLAEKSVVNPDPKLKFPHLKGTWRTPGALKEYRRQYFLAHKERYREYKRAEYKRNKATYRIRRGTEEYKIALRFYLKQHRAKYPERHKASMKQFRSKKPEYFKNYAKKYAARRRELYQIRKLEICARARELSHRPERRAVVNERARRKRIENPQFAIADALRATMNRAFRRQWVEKPKKTEALIGCSIASAKKHIESQFVNGMSWENRREFVIDHFVPVIAFDIRDLEEASWAFNWRNLRPISPHENAVKSSKLPRPLPSWLPTHIAERILNRHLTPRANLRS